MVVEEENIKEIRKSQDKAKNVKEYTKVIKKQMIKKVMYINHLLIFIIR